MRLTPDKQDRIALWQRVMDADPDALVTQSPNWMAALTSLGKWSDSTRIYEMPDGRLAVLPLARRARVGTDASPPPAWGFGGLIAEGGVVESDVAEMFGDLNDPRRMRQTMRPNPLLAAAYDQASDYGWSATPRRAHVIDLRDGVDAAWDRFDKDARRRVRRAERMEVEVECDTTGRLLPVMAELQDRSVITWAAKQHEPVRLARFRAKRRDPVEKFQAMANHLDHEFRLWIASHEGRPVAANLVLQGRNAHATRAVMDRELSSPVSATALLEWRAIEDACRSGCRRYHMGESGSSASLAKSKEAFGAVGYDYGEYRRERIPLTAVDTRVRSVVKRLIGFKD